MTPEREAHIRQIMAHSLRQTAEFERGCREFWDFMRTVRSLSEPQGTKQIWNQIHNGEEQCQK